ncbi:MAG: flippase-like domain-containing protein [Thermoplasmata archaeon]
MKISIVVPARDEERNLRSLIPRLVNVLESHFGGESYEIIIVDDNSCDGTAEVASAFASSNGAIRLIRRTSNPGFGEAVKAGLLVAKGEIVVPFMADQSDDPEDIPKLARAVEEGCDVAYGSRFLPGSSVRNYPRLKLLYNRVYNRLLRLAFSLPREDITNAFKAYRGEVLETLGVQTLRSHDFDLTAELPVRAHLAGFSSTEVPVSWRNRTAGVPKLKAARKGMIYGLCLLRLFFLGIFQGLRGLTSGMAARKGSRLRTLLAGIMGAVAVLAILALGEYGSVFERLWSVNLALLLLASSLYMAAFLFRAWRWSLLLSASGYPTTRAPILSSTFLGWMTNVVTPGRFGDLLSCMALKSTERIPFGASLGTLLFSRLLDLGILTAILVLGFGLLPELGIVGSLILVALGLTTLIGLGLLLIMRYRERLGSWFGRAIPGSERVIDGIRSALRAVVSRPRVVTASLLLSFPIWALEVGTFILIAWSLGIFIPAAWLTVAAAASFTSQALPLTPGGIGTYEAVITGILAFLGTPVSAGISLALLDHLLRSFLVILAGLAGLSYIAVRIRDKNVERLAQERRMSWAPPYVELKEEMSDL